MEKGEENREEEEEEEDGKGGLGGGPRCLELLTLALRRIRHVPLPAAQVAMRTKGAVLATLGLPLKLAGTSTSVRMSHGPDGGARSRLGVVGGNRQTHLWQLWLLLGDAPHYCADRAVEDNVRGLHVCEGGLAGLARERPWSTLDALILGRHDLGRQSSAPVALVAIWAVLPKATPAFPANVTARRCTARWVADCPLAERLRLLHDRRCWLAACGKASPLRSHGRNMFQAWRRTHRETRRQKVEVSGRRCHARPGQRRLALQCGIAALLGKLEFVQKAGDIAK